MTSAYCRAARSMQRTITSASPPAARQNIHCTVTQTSRNFSASVVYPDISMEHSYEQRRLPVTQFTEDEEMVRDAARHWANEVLRPLVRDMDNEGKTRPDVIQGLFDHGFMGM
eukprot:scaffold33812_cov114-Skeletonema_marinoi.AAC.1